MLELAKGLSLIVIYQIWGVFWCPWSRVWPLTPRLRIRSSPASEKGLGLSFPGVH